MEGEREEERERERPRQRQRTEIENREQRHRDEHRDRDRETETETETETGSGTGTETETETEAVTETETETETEAETEAGRQAGTERNRVHARGAGGVNSRARECVFSQILTQICNASMQSMHFWKDRGCRAALKCSGTPPTLSFSAICAPLFLFRFFKKGGKEKGAKT